MARGEGLPKASPPSGGDLWATLALAELYLDAGDGAKAAPLFREVVENGEGEIVAEALYGLAQSYLVTGDEENAAQALLKLTTEYPDSAYKDEAYFRLGEYCASISKPVEAGEYYNLAAASAGPYRDVARYRAAWTYYERSGPLAEEYYDRAVTTFKSFLDEADESSPYWDHAVEMTGLCLAEWEPAAAVPLDRYEEVFRREGERPYAADVLRATGDAYLYRMCRLPEAAATYEALLRDYPSYERIPAVLQNLAETCLLRYSYDDAHAARVRLVDEYGPASSWYRAQDDLTRCKAILTWENALYEVPIYYNIQAERKSKMKPEKAPALYESAINRYNQYLASFPTNEKAYPINFYLAQSYDAVEDYENAAQQYIKTATHYTDRERYNLDKWDERFTQEESFFNAILSYAELYEAADDLEGSGEIYANKLLNTCEEFLARYGESVGTAAVMEVIIKMGDVYAREGDCERAREYYLRIIAEYPEQVYTDIERGYTDEKVDALYIAAIKSIADTYLEEGKLILAGAEGAEEKYNQYRDWFERAKTEAEKRKVNFEYKIEELE
jgi:TolA-binding protein